MFCSIPRAGLHRWWPVIERSSWSLRLVWSPTGGASFVVIILLQMHACVIWQHVLVYGVFLARFSQRCTVQAIMCNSCVLESWKIGWEESSESNPPHFEFFELHQEDKKCTQQCVLKATYMRTYSHCSIVATHTPHPTITIMYKALSADYIMKKICWLIEE